MFCKYCGSEMDEKEVVCKNCKRQREGWIRAEIFRDGQGVTLEVDSYAEMPWERRKNSEIEKGQKERAVKLIERQRKEEPGHPAVKERRSADHRVTEYLAEIQRELRKERKRNRAFRKIVLVGIFLLILLQTVVVYTVTEQKKSYEEVIKHVEESREEGMH